MTVLELPATPAGPVDRVDRITAQARQWPAGRTLLSLLAALLVGVGRVAHAVCAAVWMVLTWTAAAVVVGWQDGRDARAKRATAAADVDAR